jgi:hypothetical protein
MSDPISNELPIEKEIRHEKARSLGRAGEGLEVAAKLAWSFWRYVDLDDPVSVQDYVLTRILAEKARHSLILQREALGIYSHDDVDRCYPLPPLVDRS